MAEKERLQASSNRYAEARGHNRWPSDAGGYRGSFESAFNEPVRTHDSRVSFGRGGGTARVMSDGRVHRSRPDQGGAVPRRGLKGW